MTSYVEKLAAGHRAADKIVAEQGPMVALFFGDGTYSDMVEEVYPHQGQTYRESAQERADDLASYRDSGSCGWGWDRSSMRDREDHTTP